ncbi:MAG: efflux RND transporter periplasmic adaptor subunit [Gammaproteobacteria bacterium]
MMRLPLSRRAAPSGLLVALLVAVLAACGGGGKPEVAGPTPSLVVTTVAPVRQQVERTLTVSGSVAAWQEMYLGVELTGIRVAEVLVEVGDKVRAGQPLLRLDARTLDVQARQARASVAQARANLELAKANADRGATLVKEGLISSSNSDELRATLAGAQAQLATADADRDAARLRVGFATLRAPDAGVISARTVQPGQIVSSGTDLLRLIRQGRLEWRAELTEGDLTRVGIGTTVELTSPGGERITGRVRAVSPAVDPETRTGMLYADLPEPGDLRSGMFAQGQILLGAVMATVLPREAVIFRDGFPYVFVTRPPATAGASGGASAPFNVQQRRITVGGQRGDFTEIESGVGAEERVVVRGAGFLNDGDLVREVAGTPAGKP